MTVFVPARSSGTSVVVCPGGGYNVLCDYEGRDYALWLAERGITAFVLQYRLGSSGYRHPIIAGDLFRALRLVRAQAPQWNLDPFRIGVMGSSAGGYLAATALTRYDDGDPLAEDPVERFSSRPDFGILCYPVISLRLMSGGGFRSKVVGESISESSVDAASHELHVRKGTPPCFLWHTREDEMVPVTHTEFFADALRTQGIPVEMHLYDRGRHGIALGIMGYRPGEGRLLHDWTRRLDAWLVACGLDCPAL